MVSLEAQVVHRNALVMAYQQNYVVQKYTALQQRKKGRLVEWTWDGMEWNQDMCGMELGLIWNGTETHTHIHTYIHSVKSLMTPKVR